MLFCILYLCYCYSNSPEDSLLASLSDVLCENIGVVLVTSSKITYVRNQICKTMSHTVYVPCTKQNKYMYIMYVCMYVCMCNGNRNTINALVMIRNTYSMYITTISMHP